LVGLINPVLKAVPLLVVEAEVSLEVGVRRHIIIVVEVSNLDFGLVQPNNHSLKRINQTRNLKVKSKQMSFQLLLENVPLWNVLMDLHLKGLSYQGTRKNLGKQGRGSLGLMTQRNHQSLVKSYLTISVANKLLAWIKKRQDLVVKGHSDPGQRVIVKRLVLVVQV
jgi:hypothetical protein